MLLALPLLAALVAGDSIPDDPPLAIRSTQQSGASFIVHQQPAIPLVALRMAILADDPAGYAGAGHLIQHLLLPTLQGQAAQVGGRVQMERSSDAMIYTVTGPAAELQFLASVLHQALQVPRPTQSELLAAKRALTEERLAEWETADQHVRAALRVRLFPNDLSAAGTAASAERLTLESLPRLWAALYRPERITVTGVGDVQIADLEAAFRNLPARPSARALDALQDTVSLTTLAAPQATRAWLGAGYLANDLDPAALSVVARLLRDDLRRRMPTAEVEAEHWWTHFGQALVLVASVPVASPPRVTPTGTSAPRVSTPTTTAPPPELIAARRTLGTAVATLLRDLQPRHITEAAKAIRREMLFYARTSDRMAEVLGGFADREGDPDAAQEFYAELERVEIEGVREVLQYMVEHSPIRSEIPPQVLVNPTPTPRR